MPEWVALNSVAERDDDANPEFPWYPYLFAEGMGASLSVRFATEAECLAYIKECVLSAELRE